MIATLLFVLIIIFILGLAVGSFLNVIIDRLPINKSIVKGRSYCDHCKKTISWYDLIPIFSFMILGGRCRFCKKKISAYYPLVEFISGVNFILVYYYTKPEFSNITSILVFSSLLVITSGLLVILFTDNKYLIIPDEILLIIFVATLIKIAAISPAGFPGSLLTAIMSFMFFYFIVFITRGKGMGGGDVKLAFVIGFLHPYFGALISFYLAFLTGAVVSVILILAGKKKLGQKIPFGPFLVIGCYLVIFLKDNLELIIYRLFGL